MELELQTYTHNGPFDKEGSSEVGVEACASIKHPQETALR